MNAPKETSPPRPVWRLVRLVLIALYLLTFAGFLFHRSADPVLFGYSVSYLAFLAALAVAFLVPPLLLRRMRRLKRRDRLWLLVTMGIVLSVIYAGLQTHYYYTKRNRRFDPYLQGPPAHLEAQYSRTRTPGTYRILAMGGSTTLNPFLAAEHRYCAVLQRILAAHYPDIGVEVLNAGQLWATTKHSLINYVTYAGEFDPDLVIVMHAINDLGRSFAHPSFAIGEYNDLWSHHYGLANAAARSPTFEETYLGPITAKWFSSLLEESVDFPLEKYRSLGPFRGHLERIIHTVRGDGAEIMLVSQPFLYKETMSAEETASLYIRTEFKERTGWGTTYASPRAQARAMRAFNDVTRETAATHGVFLVDAAKRIPKDLEHHTDEVHYTARGARLLAETIAGTIIELGLVDPDLTRE